MRTYLIILMSFMAATSYSQPFEIRGVLPWHNFLSGPTAWNLEDYERYLDDCAAQGINFIGFHNYTGGGERYAPYVEPMIKIACRNILPHASFDNSLTARWGYYPLKVKDFAFGTAEEFRLPPDAEAFGADCSILSGSAEEHYSAAGELMRNVVEMAHERDMQVAMGFEFGVLPPEYFSLNSGSGTFYWRGEANMVPNPAHPLAIELLYVTIDNVLETYPGIDWITLWLNEHSFMGVDVQQALRDPGFKALYEENAILFREAGGDEKLRFTGVWSLQYIRLAYNYIKKKAPGVKVLLSGWGGGNQLPVILKGLDRGLPEEIVFSCLNPGLGTAAQSAFLAEIAKNRQVWAIPWLEGDHQLWHYQPRVKLMRDQVKLAAEQQLDGVLAIHWRTEEIKLNFETFARFARDPADPRKVERLYYDYLEKNCGKPAAEALTGLFMEADTSSWRTQLVSPEYFAYTPAWGRMNEEGISKTKKLISGIDHVMQATSGVKHTENLAWFRKTFEFELLLHEVGRNIEPAWKLKNEFFIQEGKAPGREELSEARKAFQNAPVKELFQAFALKVRSRGELGELSALNQKLWVEYLAIKEFLEENK